MVYGKSGERIFCEDKQLEKFDTLDQEGGSSRLQCYRI